MPHRQFPRCSHSGHLCSSHNSHIVPTPWELRRNFVGVAFSLPGTAKGRCLQQLLAVHLVSRHRDWPMSSRLPFHHVFLDDCARGCRGAWADVSLVISSIGHGAWCHHQIGFVGSVPSWWTSRDQSGIFGLCSGRFEPHPGHYLAKPESARTSFGLRSGSRDF